MYIYIYRERERFIVLFYMVAIFCPIGLFCEINTSLLSLQKQPNTAPNLFQRGVEYGKYVLLGGVCWWSGRSRPAARQTHIYIYIYIYIYTHMYTCVYIYVYNT